MLGLDTKSLIVGAVVGFFVGPIVVGKVRQVVGK